MDLFRYPTLLTLPLVANGERPRHSLGCQLIRVSGVITQGQYCDVDIIINTVLVVALVARLQCNGSRWEDGEDSIGVDNGGITIAAGGGHGGLYRTWVCGVGWCRTRLP